MKKIVIDTNVIISAFRSSRGASNKLMTYIGTNKFLTCISVTLILEYEDVMLRHFPKMSKQKINDFLDYFCAISEQVKINYLWRPHLKDPGDDMLLELAFGSNSRYIITYNKKDFAGIEKFNIEILTPKEFLIILGVLS